MNMYQQQQPIPIASNSSFATTGNSIMSASKVHTPLPTAAMLQQQQQQVVDWQSAPLQQQSVVRNDDQAPYHVLMEGFTVKNTAATSHNSSSSTSSNNESTSSKMNDHQQQQQEQLPSNQLSSSSSVVQSSKRRRPVLERHLQNDYLAKRYKINKEIRMYEQLEQQQKQQQKPLQKQKQAPVNQPQQQQQQQQKPPPSIEIKKETHNVKNDENDDEDNEEFWHGATKLERALVACCLSNKSDNNKSSSLSSASLLKSGYHNQYRSREDTLDNDDEPGVLSRDKITTFLGLLTMQCHDVASRALALAMLEVTLESDENDIEQRRQHERQYDEDIYDNNDNHGNNPSPPSSICQTNDKVNTEVDTEALNTTFVNHGQIPDQPEGESADTDKVKERGSQISPEESLVIVKSMDPKFIHPRRVQRPSRIMLFMKAGGLKVLSRWIEECIRPVDVPVNVVNAKGGNPKAKTKKQAATTTKPLKVKTQQVASATGKLLLPILQFLQKLPIDTVVRKLVRRSGIQIKILELASTIDAIVNTWKKNESEDINDMELKTDIKAGGLPVLTVQTELNKLKEIWRNTKAKEGKEKEVSLSVQSKEQNDSCDPFHQIRSQLKDRLHTLIQHQGIDSRISSTIKVDGRQRQEQPKPEWLLHVEKLKKQKLAKLSNNAAAATSTTNASTPKKPSVQELERIERINERRKREEAFKIDLDKAQKEKIANRRRLDQINLMKKERQRQSNPVETKSISTRRRIQWKDGHKLTGWQVPIPIEKQHELLDEVFLFYSHLPANERVTIRVEDDEGDDVNDIEDDDDDDNVTGNL